ncbi:MAG: sn-glycerol-3-phosphate ABC transporter ATP-binding protein UgpC, partial [Bacteroidota bacterium]|nr:sn-glycerol-3-phosphate ABC transporter ATP-binding protein UgpC [Bacteroidota bacterium]
MGRVTIKNIAKTYDGKAFVIKDASFDIRDGEFLVLVGPSGCGKSTLLRMIAGLEEISKGDMFIDDIRVNDLPPKNRNIAMVFQNYALYPHMTAYQNMAFGLKLKKVSKSEINKRVKRAADILEITELLERKPKAMSGGQRQRIAIGRAIVRNPKVFLFDEPLSNLDAKLRVQMRVELQKLHQKLKTTMVYVTHDQTEAMTLGERIVVLKDGDIMQIGSPMELYNNPDNMFVAGFIGSPPINFIEGDIKNTDGLVFVNEKLNLRIDISQIANKGISEYVNKSVVMGIRPENISERLSNENNYQKCSILISAIEQMGNEMLIYTQLDDKQLTARLSPDISIRSGDMMDIYLDID